MSEVQELVELLKQATPGPWKVGGEWPQLVAIYDARAIYLAHANTGAGREWIGDNPLGRDVAKANARLMALAPTMAAEILRLREALEPFALFYKDESHDLSPASDHTPVALFKDQATGEPLAELWIGDFRKAHAALSPVEQEQS